MEATFSEYMEHTGVIGTVMVARFTLITIIAIGLGYGAVYLLTKLRTRNKQ